MAFILKDRVKESTTTTGTGNISLGGALATFDTFQTYLSNGDTTFYAIAHTASGVDEWEVGLGTWNTGNTLSRTTVLAGSNGTSAVDFSAGTKDIFMTYPASKAIVSGEDAAFANITVTGTVDGRDIAADGTKLDAIEASADVTDTANVTSAGALMRSGGTMTGNLVLNANPSAALGAATKQYVDTEVSSLVDSAPSTLDTLNELAAALGDDANFSTTVTNSIATKLPLAGGTLTGNLSMGDNVKAIFGAGSDLQIYHDGSNSYVKDAGTGNLNLQGENLALENTSGDNYLVGVNGSFVKLYYSGSEKLATTSTGVAITGGATFSGTSNFGDGNELRFGADNDLAIFHSSGVNHIRSDLGTLKLRSDDMRFTAQNGTSEFARFDSSGNLLVGMTTASTNNDGAGIRADGLIHAKRANVVATFNRKTSDGAIVELAKDNAVVGSIGTGGGRPYFVADNGSNGGGFKVDSTQFYPVDRTGAVSNGVLDLGYANGRWKDLHLSGAVNAATGTYTGDVLAAGLYVGSANTSYDFYNNGTTYLNGATTIDDNLLSGDIHIKSGTSGTNTQGLLFTLTDNADAQAYIKKTSYYMHYNAHQNEGHRFTVHGGDDLLRMHGANNGTRPDSIDILAANGLYMGNTQVMTLGRALTNITGATINGNLTLEDGQLYVGNVSADNWTRVRHIETDGYGFDWQHSNASVIVNEQGGTNQALVLGDVDGNGDYTGLFGVAHSTDTGSNWTKKLDLRGNGELYIGSSGTSKVFHEGNTGTFLYKNGDITSNDWNDFINGTEASWRTVLAMSGSNNPGNYTYGLALSFSESARSKFQLYASEQASDQGTSGGLMYRTGWNTTYRSWRRIWDSGNDGSGSGLDADLLDGVHGSSFLRSDADDSATGFIDFTTGSRLGAINVGGVNSSDTSYNRTIQPEDNSNLYLNYDGGGVVITNNANSGGYLQDNQSVRAPIFYDSNDTAYYGNFADTSDSAIRIAGSMRVGSQKGLYTSDSWIRMKTAHGYIDIGPANSGHAHIYTDRTNFYMNKTLNIAGGTQLNTNDARANIFYDKNDTAYYVDPATLSRVYRIMTGGTIDSTPNGTQFSNVLGTVTSNRVCYFDGGGAGASVWWGSGNTPYGAIDSDQSNGLRMWYNNSSGAWAEQFRVSDGYVQAINQSRAPIFYDSNDTAYYVNPNGTSRLNAIDFGDSAPTLSQDGVYFRITTDNGYANLGAGNGSYFHFYTDRSTFYFNKTIEVDGGGIRMYDTNADVRSYIFYDQADTNYYLDPASTSDSALRVRGGALFGGNTTWGDFLMVGGDGRQNYINSATTASVATTDGNLHLDAASGHDTYINYYDGSNVFFGSGSNTQVGRVTSAGVAQFASFADNSNTAYYLDPANTGTALNVNGTIAINNGGSSNTHGLKFTGGNSRIWFHGYRTLEGSTDGSNLQVGEGFNYTTIINQTRSPIFYDSANTAYYFDGSATGDSIRVAGNIVAYYSDERLKDIEGNIDSPLEKVSQLNGFYYTANKKAQTLGYKDNRQVGVSAQQVEAVMPEVVTDAAIGHGYKTVDYAKLVPLLIEAVKEQQDQIETLKSRLEKLEN